MRFAGRSIGLLVVSATAALAGAISLASLSSERWLAAAFLDRQTQAGRADAVWSETRQTPLPRVASGSIAGDESFWLSPASAKLLTPAVQTPSAPASPSAKGFEPGARLTLSGSDERKFDVISVVPLPADSPLSDGQGRPLVLVTARDVADTGRLTRFVVEADLPSGPAAAINKAL